MATRPLQDGHDSSEAGWLQERKGERTSSYGSGDGQRSDDQRMLAFTSQKSSFQPSDWIESRDETEFYPTASHLCTLAGSGLPGYALLVLADSSCCELVTGSSHHGDPRSVREDCRPRGDRPSKMRARPPTGSLIKVDRPCTMSRHNQEVSERVGLKITWDQMCDYDKDEQSGNSVST